VFSLFILWSCACSQYVFDSLTFGGIPLERDMLAQVSQLAKPLAEVLVATVRFVLVSYEHCIGQRFEVLLLLESSFVES